jgi:hypothetical protein
MPDIWTRHPDIVRDVLKEGGFTCGVEGRFLKGRDPAWTCIVDGKNLRGDLYIHPVEALRSEAPAPAPLPPAKILADAGVWGAPMLAFLAGAVVAKLWRRPRSGRSD